MNAELVTELEAPLQRTTTDARADRVRARADRPRSAESSGRSSSRTASRLLHPHGQGFWWLFVEPPLLVIAVGLFFHFVVVPGLLRGPREEEHATAE